MLDSPTRVVRRQRKRKRLQEAALRLFAERGYHDTAIDDVVAAARTSKSAFYEFFASKEDCLRELLTVEGGALMQAVITAAAGAEDHRQRMRLGIRAFVLTCAEQRSLARLLLVESVGVSPTIEDVRQRLHGRFAAMVEAEAARAAAKDPHYAGVSPIVFGRALVGAVHHATGQFLVQQDREWDPEALAEDLCRIFAP